LSGALIGQERIIATVVFRGSLWLDGVATTTIEAKERSYNLKLSNLITSSKQFSQLHAIIIGQRLMLNSTISIRDLARRVKLPVIAIAGSNKGPPRGRRHLNELTISVSGQEVAVMAVGVDRDEAERLYGISCSPNRKVPEAVRIADLVTKELSRTVRIGKIYRVKSDREPLQGAQPKGSVTRKSYVPSLS
jgi:endonuclease V-like protein UPF0215 family